MVPITPECSWEISERPCRKEITADGKAWSRDNSNPFKKKQEGGGRRQLVPGEEGDEGGVELKEVVQGLSTSSMVKKKKNGF